MIWGYIYGGVATNFSRLIVHMPIVWSHLLQEQELIVHTDLVLLPPITLLGKLEHLKRALYLNTFPWSHTGAELEKRMTWCTIMHCCMQMK